MLRMIAGLETVSEGRLLLDGLDITAYRPQDRDIAMAFQNYALYPHMTVYNNMAFGLKVKKFTKQEIDERISQTAELSGLQDVLDRKPKELSGGQCQRVAIGRAIVRKPKVFLMDEPLSNLDAQLRTQMRLELAKLYEKLGTTFVYVTHDQTEAMTLETKVVVMNDGKIMQSDSPEKLYQCPNHVFTASFIGTPQMNLMNAKFAENGKEVSIGSQKISIPDKHVVKNATGEIIVGIRPEDIVIGRKQEFPAVMAKVERIEILGSEVLVYTWLEEEVVVIKTKNQQFGKGEWVPLSLNTAKLHYFNKETGVKVS